jgi:hypothetical protein
MVKQSRGFGERTEKTQGSTAFVHPEQPGSPRRVTAGNEQAKKVPCPILSPFFWRKGGKHRTSTSFVQQERPKRSEGSRKPALSEAEVDRFSLPCPRNHPRHSPLLAKFSQKYLYLYAKPFLRVLFIFPDA